MEKTASELPKPPVEAAAPRTLTEEVEAFANEFGSYVDFPDLTQAQLHKVEEALLKMLTRLDELGAVIETLSRETQTMRENVAPVLAKKAMELKKLFVFIERMRILVDSNRKTLARLEADIAQEEEKLAPISMKKVLGVLSVVPGFAQPKPVEEEKSLEVAQIEIPKSKEFFDALRKDLAQM